MFKKFFVIGLLGIMVLFAGCTLPAGSRPKENLVVHIVNKTGSRLAISQNGNQVQRCLLPGQTQMFPISTDNYSPDEYFRIESYRKDRYTGAQYVASSVNYLLSVRKCEGNIVLEITHESAQELSVNKVGGGGFWIL